MSYDIMFCFSVSKLHFPLLLSTLSLPIIIETMVNLTSQSSHSLKNLPFFNSQLALPFFSIYRLSVVDLLLLRCSDDDPKKNSFFWNDCYICKEAGACCLLLNKPYKAQTDEQKVSLITTRHHHPKRLYYFKKLFIVLNLQRLFVRVCKNNLCSLADRDDDDDDGVDDEKRSLYAESEISIVCFLIFYVLFNGGIFSLCWDDDEV